MQTHTEPRRKSIYMGAPVAQTTLANGAVTNAAAHQALAKTSYLEPVSECVAPGITVFGGHSFVNTTLIEGTEGLILYDTGEVLEDGERFLQQIRAISDKPIVAIIYSHAHYTHGTSAILANETNVRIIGHPNLNANCAVSGTGSLFPETAPLQVARLLQQFNYYLPDNGAGAPAGAKINFGRSGYVPVDTPVEHGQCMTIAGVEMIFYTQHGSDSDDCLTVHLPQSGVVLNNMFWPFLPNIYTLRGAKFRDPREWAEGLKLIRDLNPETLVNTHAKALTGRKQVRAALNDVIDGLNAILDQSLRGILRGLGPDDLRDFVRLPPHLEAVPNLAQIYGEISHYGPYLYNQALGWFGGNAASINQIAPDEQAVRLVKAMGGNDRVFEIAKTAFAEKEYAWAAQLIGYVFKCDPANREVRGLKADILQHMGEITPAHTIRSWYLSQARALRGEVTIARVKFASVSILKVAEPADSMNQYRVRIDPEKSAEIDKLVVLKIADRNTRHGWHLRRGVVEFLADPASVDRKPDIELLTDYENWLRFFSARRSLDDFISNCTSEGGSNEKAKAFFSLFDFYEASENSLV